MLTGQVGQGDGGQASPTGRVRARLRGHHEPAVKLAVGGGAELDLLAGQAAAFGGQGP